MHTKSKSLKMHKDDCSKSSTLKSTVKEVSVKTKGAVSKQVKSEMSLVKVEEFLKQPPIVYKSNPQGVPEKSPRSVKQHKSSRTSFIKPFNTLKLEDPLAYTSEPKSSKVEKVATPNMKTIFAKTHRASTEKYVVTPKNVLKRTGGSKASQGRIGLATLAQKYKPASS